LTLKGQVVLASLAATGVAVGSLLLLSEARLRQRALLRTQGALLAEAEMAAGVLAGPLGRSAAPSEVQGIATDLARRLGGELTVRDASGRIVGQAGAPDPAPNGGSDAEPMSVRATVRGDEASLGTVELEAFWDGGEAEARDLRRSALAALAFAVVVTILLASYLAPALAVPIREMAATAREILKGNLEARIPARRENDLTEVATTLNSALDKLQLRLAEGAQDRVRTDAILTAMEDGVLAVDDHGTVLLANDTLRRSLDLNDPVGRHYVEVIRQREVGEVLETVLKRRERKAIEVSIRHLRRVFALTAVPFPGAEGSAPGAVLSFHDITERRRLEQVRRDFVANASHELRTPLTSIRGFVEALEDGAVSDAKTAQRFLGKIHLHSDRMASLVEDLLELSRLESGEGAPRWEEVSPAEVAEDVVASFAGLADRKGTTLTRVDWGEASVVTDADRLRRILENLVDNAVKYTPEGGRVELATGPAPEGGAVLEVRDNGNGIPPEHLPRIFERFYRVDKARSREIGGTGLGLAIVKHLAEGMGATVTVRSEVGKGTCFTILVPPRGEPRVA
jgi:two-component system phosphate regulon sensor histidine kinase PhoR